MAGGTPEPARASTIMSLSEQLTISIASKDRPEVVEATLRKLYDFGLGSCPLILCDDGSSPALDPPSLRLFAMGQLLRNEPSIGLLGSRNRIAEECTTPYLLHLDDDSYPVAGDLASLLAVAIDEKDWLAFAIPFEEPGRGRGFPRGIPKDIPLQIRSFVGCSNLVNVKEFLSIGGFSEWIGGYGEEDELALRALMNGKRVLTIDCLRVRHDVSLLNRNSTRIAKLSFRNWIMIWVRHGPLVMVPWRIIRLLMAALIVTARQRNFAALKGLLLGFKAMPILWKERDPVSMKTYRRFRTLPHVLEFYSKKSG
jgi:GT2 family glycosyltransferase